MKVRIWRKSVIFILVSFFSPNLISFGKKTWNMIMGKNSFCFSLASGSSSFSKAIREPNFKVFLGYFVFSNMLFTYFDLIHLLLILLMDIETLNYTLLMQVPLQPYLLFNLLLFLVSLMFSLLLIICLSIFEFRLEKYSFTGVV